MIFPFEKCGGLHDISKVESLNGKTVMFITVPDSATIRRKIVHKFSHIYGYERLACIYIVWNTHRKIIADFTLFNHMSIK